jgi:hypothetical protein
MRTLLNVPAILLNMYSLFAFLCLFEQSNSAQIPSIWQIYTKLELFLHNDRERGSCQTCWGGEGAISTTEIIWREDLQRPCQLCRSLHAHILLKNYVHSATGALNFSSSDGLCYKTIGFWNAQIPLILKLRKDRRTICLFLLKLGIKVCRMITERYTHLILYKRQ